MIDLISTAKLTRQSYGLAMSQVTFGGPVGIWLECTSCNESQVIVGSNSDAWADRPDEDAATVFRNHGWTGDGVKMLKARCPACNTDHTGDRRP